MYESILVPLDGSEHARMALEIAHKLATGETTLYLLHVSDVRPANVAPGGGIDLSASAMASAMSFTPEEIERMEQNVGEQIEHAERLGNDLIEQVKQAAGLADAETKAIVRMGNPADMILEEAEGLGVQAIVMGSRGMSDLASLLIGSVSHKVMHTAKCRVILVH